LQEINDSLQNENARLLEDVFLKAPIEYENAQIMGGDTLLRFEVIPGEIINKTVSNRNNSLTINKGERQGVEKGMGVISSDGIVGIVRNTSRNFSHIISLLNTQMQVSAKLKRNKILGELKWRGMDPTRVSLEAVPKHADILPGDTVVTSGYSTIFPEDFMIGKVESYTLERNGFYNVVVKLSNDFYSLDKIYIVKNLYKSELDSLQSLQ
jgi:rod shape-determining protein MreC